MSVSKNEKTGKWEVRVYYKDWTGTRKQTTKRGFATKREALEWERAFKTKEDQNVNMLFKDFVELYLADTAPRIKRNTFMTKQHIIETKILPYFGNKKLDEIRASDIRQWQKEIMNLKNKIGEPYSPVYLKTIHNQMSAILNHAVNLYGLKENVARKAGSMGKEKSKEMEFWTQDEYQKFIEQVADKPMSYYAFELLYWCGIREGELLALTPEDFNFEKKILRINKSYQRIKGEDVIAEPKTPKSNRTIHMPDFLAMEMEDFLQSLYGLEQTERIFKISKSYLHYEMDRGAKVEGIKRIKVHGFRTKQEYLIQSALEQKVTAVGNPLMLVQFRQQLARIEQELQRINEADELEVELFTPLYTMVEIMDAFKENEQEIMQKRKLE